MAPVAAARKIVSSPAIVPTTPSSSASSRARATGCAAAGGVLRTTRVPAARDVEHALAERPLEPLLAAGFQRAVGTADASPPGTT